MATLTTVLGANLTNKEADPSVKIDASQEYGKLRVLYDSYTVDAADEFGTSGLVRLMTIPKNARLISAEAAMEAAGATGIFEIGWAASAELDEDGVTVEAADADGIMIIDPGAAAVTGQKMVSTAVGYMKKFAGAVEVQADCTEVTADSGGDVLELLLFIAVD